MLCIQRNQKKIIIGEINLYPLILKPTIKDYIWGGQKLKTEYNKYSEHNKLAESWELSCHKDGMSIIDNGEFCGLSLQDYINRDRKGILGTKCCKSEYFPILVKLIDAKDNLSIQVHPDNEYALTNEGQYGKTEMWYIIDCKPGSIIYYGLNRDLSRTEFIEKIKNNTFLDTLNAVKVKKGDVFLIESGTIHAICSNTLIAEIQQNSNITYRIYDYNRCGNDGKPRDLHIEKALDVTSLKKQKLQAEIYDIEETTYYSKQKLVECDYFTTYKVAINKEINLTADGETFHCLLCLDGILDIHYNNSNISFKKGQTIFIPANMGNYKIKGIGEILFVTL